MSRILVGCRPVNQRQPQPPRFLENDGKNGLLKTGGLGAREVTNAQQGMRGRLKNFDFHDLARLRGLGLRFRRRNEIDHSMVRVPATQLPTASPAIAFDQYMRAASDTTAVVIDGHLSLQPLQSIQSTPALRPVQAKAEPGPELKERR